MLENIITVFASIVGIIFAWSISKISNELPKLRFRKTYIIKRDDGNSKYMQIDDEGNVERNLEKIRNELILEKTFYETVKKYPNINIRKGKFVDFLIQKNKNLYAIEIKKSLRTIDDKMIQNYLKENNNINKIFLVTDNLYKNQLEKNLNTLKYKNKINLIFRNINEPDSEVVKGLIE